MRLETGDWRLETGDWRLETGDWRLETGDWRLETADWSPGLSTHRLVTLSWRTQESRLMRTIILMMSILRPGKWQVVVMKELGWLALERYNSTCLAPSSSRTWQNQSNPQLFNPPPLRSLERMSQWFEAARRRSCSTLLQSPEHFPPCLLINLPYCTPYLNSACNFLESDARGRGDILSPPREPCCHHFHFHFHPPHPSIPRLRSLPQNYSCLLAPPQCSCA
ncbi:hypothetical protein K402DRAFT_141956 [Aulographum hederae CBS 113979]|uniref:Uncharacterized protein n=1 Tax=Aulographum hederae CBS 113979 TaxID=1176131 RepID=A0A6G1GTQ1_9PEZI|nr:hypothetical protein K402DRAFT_141956 [Aulographum hederae CBS 113979]